MSATDGIAQLRAQLDHKNTANRARAQLHRWYAFYERDTKHWDNQFDLLTDDMEIIRGVGPEGGIEIGKDAYRRSVEAFPTGQGHGHHIKRFQLLPIGTTGQWLLSVDLHYHNRSEQGDERAGALHYAMQLAEDGSLLPKIRRVVVELDDILDEPFEDAYPINRAAGLVHYWLALLESRDPDTAPLPEIIADDAVFHLSDGRTLDGLAEISTWYADLPGLVHATHHDVENLSVRTDDKGHLLVSMDLAWLGIDTKDQPVRTRTHHEWTVADGDGRFPVLREARITRLEVADSAT
ncbi:nuclear transport factor 2 family protein [Streptomyces sp. NPDC086835]|uniref:nuclear transport factor 2 family protein n=1 Tax=Streptomyces sp. NPDC086835 TaxID=3365761 RepID=UPI003813273C